MGMLRKYFMLLVQIILKGSWIQIISELLKYSLGYFQNRIYEYILCYAILYCTVQY